MNAFMRQRASLLILVFQCTAAFAGTPADSSAESPLSLDFAANTVANGATKTATNSAANIGVSSADVSGTLLVLVAIVALLFAGSYLMKRLRIVSGPAQLGVSVVGQIPMSVKEKLLVIQVGDEKILVGSAGGNMRTLHRWASPADEQASAAAEPIFARLMRGQKPVNSGEVG